MSRGPGRIERAIRALLDAPPDDYEGFGSEDLAEHCYPGVTIERKHRVVVLRAAHKIVAADPAWTFERAHDAYGGTPIPTLEFFRHDNPPTWVLRKRERTAKHAEWRRRLPQVRTALNQALSSPQPAARTTLSAIADKARALITQNDPDAVRAGLAEIADALDAMKR